jgi:polyisoprenoid-binding protein YceI
MMKRIVLIAALAAITCAGALSALAQTTSEWQIDSAHANAQFTVRHMGISNVQGEFGKITGTMQLNEQDVTKSSVMATIDVNSLNTRNSFRDQDVKSDGYFDAAKFPSMTFQSRKITRVADGKLAMTGDLTLHGVTREVTFDVDGPTDAIKDPRGAMRRGASASAKIRRSDFGMTKGIPMVGDDVNIQLDLEFVKK